jgi:hypothetical protein
MDGLENLAPLLAGLACVRGVDGRQATARCASVWLCLVGYCMMALSMTTIGIVCTVAGLGVAGMAMHAKLGWVRGRIGRR